MNATFCILLLYGIITASLFVVNTMEYIKLVIDSKLEKKEPPRSFHVIGSIVFLIASIIFIAMAVKFIPL